MRSHLYIASSLGGGGVSEKILIMLTKILRWGGGVSIIENDEKYRYNLKNYGKNNNEGKNITYDGRVGCQALQNS